MPRCFNCMNEYDEDFDVCPHCGYINGTPPESAFQLCPGEMLADRYIIGTAVGFGGFGIIYRAWDTKLEVRIAIKEYYPSMLVNRIPGTNEVIAVGNSNKQKEFHVGLDRFLGEARTMASFNTHPNIVHIFDFFKENNTAYFVMEYLNGSNLKEYIKKKGILSIDESIDIILKISSALESMHKENIIHRDVNLNNIMICNDGSIKLIDFGAARASSGEMSRNMSIVLTPGYAPPEQYESKSKQGPWTDIYALSATLYHMVTGVRPLESSDRVDEDKLEHPMELNSEVPEWLDRTIMTGMALNYELRFKDIAELKKGLQHEKSILYPHETIKKKKNIRLAAVIASIAVFVGMFSMSMLYLASYHGWFVENGTLSMWLPDNGMSESIKRTVAEYQKLYNGKKIELTLIPSDEYAAQLNQAAEEGNLPDIFVSDYIDDKYVDELADLQEITEGKGKSEYYLIDKYSSDIDANNYVPLGFNAVVIYENTDLSSKLDDAYESESVIDVGKVKISSKASHTTYDTSNMIINKYLAQTFGIASTDKALNKFTDAENQTIPYYIGLTDERRNIQDTLAGYNNIYGLSNEGIMYAEFADKLSVSDNTFNEHSELVSLWIDYLLSEKGQNNLYLQSSHALPINKNTFEKYSKTIKSFAFMKDYYNKFEICEYETIETLTEEKSGTPKILEE